MRVSDFIKNNIVRLAGKLLPEITEMILCMALGACGETENTEVSLFNKEKIVGTDMYSMNYYSFITLVTKAGGEYSDQEKGGCRYRCLE